MKLKKIIFIIFVSFIIIIASGCWKENNYNTIQKFSQEKLINSSQKNAISKEVNNLFPTKEIEKKMNIRKVNIKDLKNYGGKPISSKTLKKLRKLVKEKEKK